MDPIMMPFASNSNEFERPCDKPMTPLPISPDFPMPDLEDQLCWSASLGLDLADRTVLEAEVLIWLILQKKSALMRRSLNQKESDSV
jgi:hypothetical protein